MAMEPAKDQSEIEGFDANYEAFMECGAQSSLFADEAFLREMGIYEEVENVLEVSGWKGLLTLSSDTNVEDTCEFLASVQHVDKYLRYRHRGVYYQITGAHLKRAFGWTTSARDETDQHSEDDAWAELTWSDKKFRAGRSLGTEIREPKFYYLHRLISHTVLARHNGAQRLGVLDIAIMKGLVYGKKVQFGLHLASHWTKIRPTGVVLAGGMITYFLRRMHFTDHLEEQTILSPEFLTRRKMSRMKGVRILAEGEVEWCYEGFAVVPMNEGIPMDEENVIAQEAAQEEQPAARGRRARAPVREQGPPVRRSARARNQASSSAQEQSRAQAEYPWMDPQVQRRWMFNVERVMEFHAPENAFMNMEPPPEWTPGMPIPSGYRMREEASDDESHEHDMDDLEAESSRSSTF